MWKEESFIALCEATEWMPPPDSIKHFLRSGGNPLYPLPPSSTSTQGTRGTSTSSSGGLTILTGLMLAGSVEAVEACLTFDEPRAGRMGEEEEEEKGGDGRAKNTSTSTRSSVSKERSYSVINGALNLPSTHAQGPPLRPNMLHILIGCMRIPDHVLDRIIKAVVYYLETHPTEAVTVNWTGAVGEGDVWGFVGRGETMLATASRCQRLSLVWPRIRHLPAFADADAPVTLTGVVWDADWVRLRAEERAELDDSQAVHRVHVGEALGRMWKLSHLRGPFARSLETLRAVEACELPVGELMDDTHDGDFFRVPLLLRFIQGGCVDAVRCLLPLPPPHFSRGRGGGGGGKFCASSSSRSSKRHTKPLTTTTRRRASSINESYCGGELMNVLSARDDRGMTVWDEAVGSDLTDDQTAGFLQHFLTLLGYAGGVTSSSSSSWLWNGYGGTSSRTKKEEEGVTAEVERQIAAELAAPSVRRRRRGSHLMGGAHSLSCASRLLLRVWSGDSSSSTSKHNNGAALFFSRAAVSRKLSTVWPLCVWWCVRVCGEHPPQEESIPVSPPSSRTSTSSTITDAEDSLLRISLLFAVDSTDWQQLRPESQVCFSVKGERDDDEDEDEEEHDDASLSLHEVSDTD